ncbi:MAG: hypothetical protein AYK22_03315 [Thermoplasmatales archaeon SG8-52-3]|nr:MAG: hypothetical protein AYK22_03315 [Thermoplasmatales archaeon SG8-52-3]
MPPDDDVDELVDKAIDEIIARAESRDDEIKKRRPKPFRYLTDKEDIQAELARDEMSHITVMGESPAAKIVDDKLAILGLGDVETIENVLKKHKGSRKFK